MSTLCATLRTMWVPPGLWFRAQKTPYLYALVLYGDNSMAGEIRVGFGPRRDAQGNVVPHEQAIEVQRALERSRDDGPHLAMAVFCEQVIEGRDGLFSLVRIFDRLFIAAGPQEAVFPVTVPIRMHFSFRYNGGGTIGFIGIRQQNPDGEETIIHSFGIGFPEGRTTLDQTVVLPVTFLSEGLYRFDILDKQQLRITQMPLHVSAGVPPDTQVLDPTQALMSPPQ